MTHRLSMRVRRSLRAFVTILWTVMTLSICFNSALSKAPTASPAESWSYADLADVFAAAPIVLRARIVEATRLKDSQRLSLPPSRVRHYVVGTVPTLIRGPGGVPPRLAWLVDVAPDSRGNVPKLKKADVLIAALPVPGRPGEIRLAARDAQLTWSAALESRVRAIVQATSAPGAPPAITGISSAFHVVGTLPGESETQIFLSTATQMPVSLSILRRPGEEPRWSVALGEIVDEAAAPPARDTLGWYRLACFLPAALPPSATAELGSEDATAARADYAFVIDSLGPCARTRTG